MPQVLRAGTALGLALLLSAAVGCITPSPNGLLSGASGSSGFPTVPVSPAPGFLFSDYKAPLNFDFEGQAMGSQLGSSEAIYIGLPRFIFGYEVPVLGMGDASLAAAAGEGGLSVVNHVDYEVFNVLGIFSRFTVHAYGN